MTTFSFILLSYLLSDSFKNFMAGFAVLTVGILHGANDLEILSKKFKGSLNHLYTRFLILYLMVVLLGAAFFFIIPSFTLILFVIFNKSSGLGWFVITNFLLIAEDFKRYFL